MTDSPFSLRQFDPRCFYIEPAQRIIGDERAEFLVRTADQIHESCPIEPTLFLNLSQANEVYCQPPLSRREVRDLSVSAWERLKHETVSVEPGGFEDDVQTDTDTGFGKHFIRDHGSYVRYNPDTQCWLYYEQGAWREDGDGVVITGLVKEMFIERQNQVERMIAELRPRWEAAGIEDRFFNNGNPKQTAPWEAELFPEELALARAWFKLKAEHKEALSGQSSRRVSSALDMARTEDGVAIYNHQWDANPLLFNTFKHTVNLANAKIEPHRFTDLLTMQSLVELNPGAPCKRFEQVLARSLPDKDVREYLRDFAGLCLSGLMCPDILIFLGEGANGKGLIVRVLSGILGSYAGKCAMSSFLASANPSPGGARSDLSSLRGKRLVTAAEANRKVSLDIETLKDWTGGEDFNARDLYERAKKGQFKPQGKLILSMNNPPRITDQSHATWRRLRYVSFDVIIPAAERNDNLAQELLETEGGGIFNWMLKGWMRVAERLEAGKPALVAPASVLAKTDEFKDKENQAGRFFTDELSLVPQGKIKSADVYERYKMWCHKNGEYTMFAQRLTMELQRYCHDKGHNVDWGEKSHHQSWHWGLALRALEPGERNEPPPHNDEDQPF